MSLERAKKHLEAFKLDERIQEFDVSSATVALAAEALGIDGDQICKSLAFKLNDKPILILMSGHARLDNRKYKDYFKTKAKMLSPKECTEHLGHDVGGICPFGLINPVEVYLDESLKKHEEVYPACGSSNSAVRMNLKELYKSSLAIEWIDVAK